MQRRESLSWAIFLAMSLLPVGGTAHHSFSAFDIDREVTVRGIIVKFDWMNPHTRTWIEVTDDDGAAVIWELEGMSPDYLGRRGWTRSTLRTGEAAEITIHPLRSGAPGGTFLRATLADGTVVVMFGR